MEYLVSSELQTKNWRKDQEWYLTGKQNECEKYQVSNIEKILNRTLEKTNERINTKTMEILSEKTPMKRKDAFYWTENFDRKIILNDNTYYFNLKMVCDSGGSQTRTLREVFYFINYQMDYLIKYNTTNKYFINILDGDECFRLKEKITENINNEEYKEKRQYIFVGSLCEFYREKHVYHFT
jgi:hypothetical protein